MDNLLDNIKASIKNRIPSYSFEMWIEPLEFIRCNNDILTVSCPNSFSKKRVEEHFASLVEKEAEKISKKDLKLSIEIAKKQKRNINKTDNHKRQMFLPNFKKFSSGRFLRKDFTFDKFIIGNNNNFAYSAARLIASSNNSYQNALLLLSKTGMGKSHLSQAIGHSILTKRTAKSVYYITAEDFTNEMVVAFKENSLNTFKDKYQKQCDVLLIEDIHFLSGKKRSQKELALILDMLYDANKKIIFTSRYLPIEIPKLDESLRSRISSSLISNISKPDFKTRVKILEKKSQFNGYTIPKDVILYLAGELTENIRQLESGLFGIASKSSLIELPIDLPLAKSVVKNIITERKKITIDTIKKNVCKYYGIQVQDIISRSRRQSILRPRQVAMYLSRKYTDQPLQAIGRSFNRYHATALHSINAVEKGIKANAALDKQVELLCKKLDSNSL